MNESKEKSGKLVKLIVPYHRYEPLAIAITTSLGLCIEHEEAKDKQTICFTVLYDSIEYLLRGFFAIRRHYGDNHYDICIEWQ